MKQLYSFVPAVVFAAGIILFISANKPIYTSAHHLSSIQAEGSEADDGLIQYELQRLCDPATGKIPSDIRRMELEYAATLPGYSSQNSGLRSQLSSLNWKSRGPWNVGGRTRAFAVDKTNPFKLLAGSTSGGMWASLNGGTSWTQCWNAVHQSVSCIAQDIRAGKTNTWYIGTGEGYGQSASGGGNAYYLGNGMYKSTDGGLTWNSIASTVSGTPQSFDNVWDIIWNVGINPSDTTTNGTVYASTYGAIMKSTNGGTSWTVVKGSAASSPFSYFTDVAVAPSGVVYATLSSDGSQKGIWRSTNGTTWTNVTPSGFPTTYGRVKIGISPSDENQVYFFAGVTTGFGTPDTNFMGQVEWNSLWKYHYDATNPKWYDLSANLPTTGGLFDKQYVQGGYDMVIKVHPTDTSIVFLGGTNLYRSHSGFFTSGNTTFIGGYEHGGALPVINSYMNHHPDQHEIAFDPSNANSMYSTNDGGIFKTNNDTASTVAWSPLNNGYLTSMFYTVGIDHIASGDSTIIGGAQDNGSWFAKSNNPQALWTSPRGGDGSYCAIANNKLNYYFSIQNGKMMQATLNASDSVQTFSRIDPIGGKGYQFINPFTLDPNNMNRMYLAGGKNLWRNDSLDIIYSLHTKNWDSISTGWTLFPDTLPIPWVPVNGILTGASITAVAVSKNPANIVYYGTSNKHLYRVDNANSGTPAAVDITGSLFPGGYVSSIAIDPADAGKVMVCFSNYNVYSIFYSSNADSPAVTWKKVAGNLEQNSDTTGIGKGPSVRWVSIMPVFDGTVFLAATSTGLYATDTLMGTSTLWAQQGASTIGNSICDMIDYRITDGLVAVATHSHGIFTTNITSIGQVLSAHELSNLPTFRLSNFPNPFSSSTAIRFTLSQAEKINLGIYNLQGENIQTLSEGSFSSGEHQMNFSNANISQGAYFLILRTETAIQAKKLIIIK